MHLPGFEVFFLSNHVLFFQNETTHGFRELLPFKTEVEVIENSTGACDYFCNYLKCYMSDIKVGYKLWSLLMYRNCPGMSTFS